MIPSNLYGEYDNFNLEQAHVIPALVRKFYEAVKDGHKQVEVWGDGSAKRDFIHSTDVAQMLVEVAERYDGVLPIDSAYGQQHAIREVVSILTDVSGFRGEIVWDTNRPSGQKSREMSLDNLRQHLAGVGPKIDLRNGLTLTYRWLAENYASGDVRL